MAGEVYEPAVLQLVKRLVRVAARRVGHMRVRSHRASLVHNSPKARRRSVALLEECLVFASMARGGVYFTLETAKYRLWSPRGDWVPPEHRADVLMASPMVAFMDLYSSSGASTCGRRIACTRYGRVQVSIWELTGSADGWQVCVEVCQHRARPPRDPQTSDEE